MRYLIDALHHPKDFEWRRLRPWQRHSQVLAVAGSVYLGIGTAFMVVPRSPERAAALEILLGILPLQAWGMLWAAVGLLALVSTRWPPASKTWGYTALTGVATIWSSAYLLGVLLLGTPVSGGLLGSLVYGLVAYLWYAIAGLANPDDLLCVNKDQELTDNTFGE